MVRYLYKETKAGVFWPFEKTRGLAKEHLARKDRWDKRKRKTKKAMGKGHTQGRNMVYGFRAQSPKYDWDQGSEERAQGSEEWDQGSQGF